MPAFLPPLGTSRGDRIVAGIAVAAFGLATVVTIQEAVDPQRRAVVLWLEQYPKLWPAGTTRGVDVVLPLFGDANGHALLPTTAAVWSSTRPPSRTEPRGVSYEALQLRDPWASPWIAVVPDDPEPPSFVRIYSRGPNGSFEWGEGDDVLVPTDIRRVMTYGSSGWLILAAMVSSLVAVPWLAIRCWLAPRSPQVATEVVLAAGMGLGPAAVLTIVVMENHLGRSVPMETRLLVVGPDLAVAASLTLCLWGLALALRLRRPLPDS